MKYRGKPECKEIYTKVTKELKSRKKKCYELIQKIPEVFDGVGILGFKWSSLEDIDQRSQKTCGEDESSGQIRQNECRQAEARIEQTKEHYQKLHQN